VLAPLATLILIQMMFLPYHYLAITWWHRGLVLVDLVVIIVMWSRFFAYSGIESQQFFLFPQRGSLRGRVAQAAYFGVVAVAFWLSLWEGRWAGEPVVGRAKLDWRGVVWGLFPDRLKLATETIVGEERWKKANEEITSRRGAKRTTGGDDFVPTVDLHDRDLQEANLTGADLRGVSLDGAIMLGAKLLSTR
jgi:Pentapeptide repeats (8 copies)